MSETRVYFIASARSKAVKIGVADDVQLRMGSLQSATANRLSLLGQMPGDERFEKALHQRFSPLRIRGEWFRHEGDLASFISLLPVLEDEPRPASRVRREERSIVGLTAQDRADIDRALEESMDALRDVRDIFGGGELATEIGIDRSDLTRAFSPGSGRRLWFESVFQIGRLASMELRRRALRPLARCWGLDICDPKPPMSDKERADVAEAVIRSLGALAINAHETALGVRR